MRSMPFTSSLLRAPALVSAILLASCQAVPPAPLPPPQQAPPPPAAPPSPPPPVQSDLSWEVAPTTLGDWRYDRSGASFLVGDRLRVTLTCRAASRQLELAVWGVPGSAQGATIRTSFGSATWAGAVTYPPDGGTTAILRMARAAGDSGFDWMAYSRGRVAIEIVGGERIILPVVGEIGRVVEDCRN